jgi:pilus assembly protein CpaE
MHGRSTRVKQNVVAFLPAKAGVGATTVAINTAARLSSIFGKRVLVCEGDMHSGVIAELLRLEPKASMQQTLESADGAETLIWPRHVCHKDGVDFLLARREHNRSLHRWHDYHHLLSFISNRYDYVVFDLPELIDDAAAEVVQSARNVYLTTTPEILSLHLARQRAAELREAGVDSSSLRIVVNRRHHTDFAARHIEEVLDCPVEFELPNDYPAVQAATAGNTFVDRHTALGRAYSKAAGAIANEARPQTQKRSLFGFLRRYDERLVAQRG